ncbi:MAG: GNAT family N-acetyltransferase [candidate division Zixibacteria bacterium]|nr:GNAT family N-acetyltransferase [candidate division Zixibacteria bacterium]
MEGPRSPAPHEMDSLYDLVNTVFRSGSAGRMENQYPLLFTEENRDHLFVVTDAGRVVAHVGAFTRDISVLGCTLKTMSIGAVATLESYRGAGLATRLMETAIRTGRAEGSSLMLISGSRGLYRRLGTTRAGRYVVFTASRSVLPSGPVEIAPATETDLPALVRLYAHEPVRYIRSVTDFQGALCANWIVDRAGETLTVSGKEGLLAYVAVQTPNSASEHEANRVRIVEMAGSRVAIGQALPAIMGRYGVSTIEVIALESDRDTARFLAGYGVFPQPEGFGGTSIVLDPERFLTAFAPYVKTALGPDRLRWSVTPEEIVFSCEGQTLTVTPSTLGLLWFGVVEPDADPRLTVAAGTPLREGLDTLLPVQLPWYGHNYV